MATKLLTIKYLEALERKLAKGEAVKEWHADGGGIFLRARKSGHLSFYVRQGARPPILIGPVTLGLPKMRQNAAGILARLANGEDVNAEKKAKRVAAKLAEAKETAAPAKTFEQVWRLYVAEKLKPRLRTWLQPVGAIEKDVMPRWRNLPLADVSRLMGSELIDAVAKRGAKPGGKSGAPVAAARLQSYLHAFFRWAMGKGYVENNPFAAMPKPNTNGPRDRVLKDHELRLVWLASERLGGAYEPILKLLILTGQRRSEIALGRWSEVDLAAGTWSLPKERVKNKRPHTFPLSPAAVAILEALPRNGDMIFDAGRASNMALKITGAIPQLNKIIAELNGGEEIPPFTVHDLRRTAATGMADIGIAPHVVEAVLNHVSGHKAGVAGVYNHSRYETEAAAAANAWAARVREIVTGEAAPTNVVTLKGRAAP
jgi:integrase